MWTHFAFVDIFGDAYLAKHHSHYRNIASCPVGLMGLSSALLFITSVLESLERASDNHCGDGQEKYCRALLGQNASAAPVVRKISAALNECADMCNRLVMAAGNPNAVYEMLLLVRRCKDMRLGDVLILPGGWAAASTTDPSQHVVLYVVHKARSRKSKSAGAPAVFQFAVVNTGDGLEHHLQNIDPHTGLLLQNLAFNVVEIAQEKLCDGAFWFLLYRMLCFPSRGTSA